jgi:acetylornithine deacetylase/succinyl-diaminopimelate desuccinylase-like protein
MDDLDAGRWAADALVRLVAAPSPSGREGPAVDEAERLAGELGLPVQRMPVDGCGDNLLIGETGRPSLLLNAHLDTVDAAWDVEAPRLEGDRVHGLGSVDDKGQAVAALLALHFAGAPAGVAVGLTVDEESEGRGSLAMAAAVRPAAVIVGEGTKLRIADRESGHVEGTLTFTGRSLHGAYARPEGNPIHDLARLIAGLDADPIAPPEIVAAVVRELHGGGAMNVSPADARAELHARVDPGGDAAVFARELERRVLAAGGSIEFVEVAEPWSCASSPVARQLAEALDGADTILMPAWTDAHNFVEVAGSEAVVFGPGDLLDAHRPGESIAVADIVRAARAMAQVIERVEVMA